MTNPNLATPTEMPRSSKPYREIVRAGVSASAEEHLELYSLLDQISPQVDEVCVYLNDTRSIPEPLHSTPDNIRFFCGPNLGTLEKFVFLEAYTGYYVPLDIKVKYEKYHVSRLIAAVETYDRRAIVGWFPRNSGAKDTSLPSLTTDEINIDRPTDIRKQALEALDTSNICFHTDSFRFDWRRLGSDVTDAAILGQSIHQDKVGLVLLDQGTARASLIVSATSNVDGRPRRIAKQKNQNDIESDETTHATCYQALSKREKRVSVIGRVNRKRWKKGGILKSVLFTEEMLTAHGCTVELIDIEEDDVFKLNRPDILIIYVGDPERPDFAKVHKIVEHHASRGVPVLVNLSEDHFPSRTCEIRKVMSDWHDRYNGAVSMMTFSHNVDSRPEYESFNSSIVPLPKTLSFSHHEYAEYSTSSGIFVGDVAKLSDPRIVGSEASKMLRMLRSAIPEARIYGLQQYKSKYEPPRGIDEVWPFMPASDLAAKLSHIRLMVSFPKYATYEMVPVEASALGVPLLYADMPQSLNETIGFAGYRYKDDFDLINSAQTIYRDPVIWRQYSRSGIRRAKSQDYDVTSAKIYLAIKNFVERHNKRKIWS